VVMTGRPHHTVEGSEHPAMAAETIFVVYG